MKFDYSIDYNKRNNFLQKLYVKKARRLVSIYFDSPQLAIQQKQFKNCVKL